MLPAFRAGGGTLILLVFAAGIFLANGDATFNLWINKYYYLLKTSWGKPSQDLYMALDLGSQDFWLYGGMCYVISKTCSLGTNNYYRKVNSTTYSARSGTYTLNYNTIYQWNGSVSMGTGNDMFTVGSYSLGTLDFGVVDHADWSMYKKVNMSGILGLGLQSMTGITGYLSTFLGLGSSSGNKNITLYTDRNSSAGVLTIGKPDSTHCSSSWTFVPTISSSSSRKYWEISLSSFRFGSYSSSSLSGHTAVFSTMISYMIVPQAVFTQIRSRVRQVVFDYSYAHNLVDCDDRWRFPDMSFTINGQVFNVTSYEYIWKTPTNFCILKIVPNGGGNRWVFGYPFHQGHCEHYNFNSNVIGLTKRL
ncbi:Peptidase A1 [Aphelenchoides bicaudatus]|nr:Peptidase A1 [Aphelenchoides bicaudatus]